MSITPASAQYFNTVASAWDSIRSGYFSEAVRTAAIQKAYLRPEMSVADVGAGTGFMTAGLAPLVKKVHVLDGSAAMLEVARQKLQGFSNLVFHEADGLSLPLPDNSLDAVFANMYMHHTPDPLAALREMARLLKPGGRLVITDMDAHTHEWFKDEMADVWLGFERDQVRAWFGEAGLVNVIVTCSGESCCAESHNPAIQATDGRTAQISVFLAVGTKRVPGVREAVQSGYGAAAEGGGGCCSPDSGPAGGCCGGGSETSSPMDALAEASRPASTGQTGEPTGALISLDDIPISTEMSVQFNPNYSPTEQSVVPSEAAELALGCGNPTAFAGLQPGEAVLDIGSGAGMDAFLAARQVGPTGRVIGVDMTPAMLERARRASAAAGLDQVEFRQGQAEALPLEDASVDVILSNCVINLTEDKGHVFREAYRVLKPGGRLEISDMVTDRSFPLDLLADPSAWPGCVFGALPEGEYLDLVAQAGFTNIQTRRSSSSGSAAGVPVYSLAVSARKGDVVIEKA